LVTKYEILSPSWPFVISKTDVSELALTNREINDRVTEDTSIATAIGNQSLVVVSAFTITKAISGGKKEGTSQSSICCQDKQC
jgi:hypothetical protein